jgi:hypothetical protein
MKMEKISNLLKKYFLLQLISVVALAWKDQRVTAYSQLNTERF